MKTATLFPLIVGDQDETRKYYTETLGFEKKGDVEVDVDRWLTIAAPRQAAVLVLHRVGPGAKTR